ncbi:MAG: permease-like cell division protein FtsX [Bacteroidota bacterium]
MILSGDYKPTKRSNPSYLYSILSVALVLFLLGFFSLFLIHAPKWVKAYKEHVNIMIEVKGKTNQEEIVQLTNTLKNIPYIKGESVAFVSKEQIAEEMKEELGTAENTLEIVNPFYDMVIFNLEADYMQKDSIENIRAVVLKNPVVKDLFFQELLVDDFNANLKRIGYVAIFLGLFFVLIAVVLIHNTIRLAMYSNRFLIKNMQLVGATWKFISQPYLNRGLINGLWSGGLAIVLLVSVVFFINYHFPEMRFDVWLKDYVGIILVMMGLV